MGRFSPSGSSGHHIQRIAPGHFRISWTFDTYVAGSRLRYPKSLSRDTDEAGARRFAAKWGVPMPVSPAANDG